MLFHQGELLCICNGKGASLNERGSTVNCPKFSFAFCAGLQTGNVMSFSSSLLLLVTHPTSAAAASREAFTYPESSLVNQCLKGPYVAGPSPPIQNCLLLYVFESSVQARFGVLRVRHPQGPLEDNLSSPHLEGLAFFLFVCFDLLCFLVLDELFFLDRLPC